MRTLLDVQTFEKSAAWFKDCVREFQNSDPTPEEAVAFVSGFSAALACIMNGRKDGRDYESVIQQLLTEIPNTF